MENPFLHGNTFVNMDTTNIIKNGQVKSPVKDTNLSGFRIIDYEFLCKTFSLVLCRVSEFETLALQECLVLTI